MWRRAAERIGRDDERCGGRFASTAGGVTVANTHPYGRTFRAGRPLMSAGVRAEDFLRFLAATPRLTACRGTHACVRRIPLRPTRVGSGPLHRLVLRSGDPSATCRARAGGRLRGSGRPAPGSGARPGRERVIPGGGVGAHARRRVGPGRLLPVPAGELPGRLLPGRRTGRTLARGRGGGGRAVGPGRHRPARRRCGPAGRAAPGDGQHPGPRAGAGPTRAAGCPPSRWSRRSGDQAEQQGVPAAGAVRRARRPGRRTRGSQARVDRHRRGRAADGVPGPRPPARRGGRTRRADGVPGDGRNRPVRGGREVRGPAGRRPPARDRRHHLGPQVASASCSGSATGRSRPRCGTAHQAAVVEALGYLESVAGHGLRGHQGDGQRAAHIGTDGWIVAAFEHHTSRAGDPQLHTHLVVPNLLHGADGKWSAVDSKAVYRHALTASYLYHAVLRAQLTAASRRRLDHAGQG